MKRTNSERTRAHMKNTGLPSSVKTLSVTLDKFMRRTTMICQKCFYCLFKSAKVLSPSAANIKISDFRCPEGYPGTPLPTDKLKVQDQ